MLCPSCGTEVGETMSLCPRCSARQQSESSGSAIGAIRPALRVVRLKPGEPVPPEFRAQSSSQPHASDTLPPPRELPREAPSRVEHVIMPEIDTASKRLPHIAIAVMLVAVVAALFILLRASDPDALFSERTEKAPPDLSHIVIRQKQEIVVDNINVLGVIRVRDEQLPLNRVEASWSEGKNVLELNYFANKTGTVENLPLGIQSKADSPLVKVMMQFGTLKGRLEKDKLQSYLIQYTKGDEALRAVKSYSVRLAAFGEVAVLTGTLKNGEKVHGKLEGSHTAERGGETVKMSWQLGFDAPLKVVP